MRGTPENTGFAPFPPAPGAPSIRDNMNSPRGVLPASASVDMVIASASGAMRGKTMEWFFDGLGTMLIGLVVGALGGTGVTWRVMSRKHNQRQKARDGATQIQAGRDVKDVKP
jgi:uncharacterized membrane protein